jgi:MFS family permease
LTNPAPQDHPGLSWRKVGLLSSLYFVQGLPSGFLILTLPLYLYDLGMRLEKITAFAVVSLPWLLKFLWAPLADKYYWSRFGRRRSWILPAQAGLVLTLLATGLLVSRLTMVGFLVVLTIVSFCAATQDIGVDGLAVDILDDHERGVGNSVQAAAFKIGMIGGGAGLTWALSCLGIEACFYLMAGAVAVAMLAPLLLREPPPPSLVADQHEGRQSMSVLRLVGQIFTRRGAAIFILLVLASKAGDSIANPLFRLFLRIGYLTKDQINYSMNIGGMIATLIGSAICGFIIMRIGRRAALWITLSAQGLSHLAWAAYGPLGLPLFHPPTGGAFAALWTIIVLEHLVSGMLTVVVFTLMMDAVRPEAGSGQYTLLMCVYMGAGILLNIASGWIALQGGFPVAYCLAVSD